jgi:phosphohistidine phosphatase SixA
MDKRIAETAYRNGLLTELVCEDEITADDVPDLIYLSSSTRRAMETIQHLMSAGKIEPDEKFELKECYRKLETTEQRIKAALRRVLI